MVFSLFQYLVNRPAVRDSAFQPREAKVNWPKINGFSLDRADGFSNLQAQENELLLARNNTYRKQPLRSRSDGLFGRNDWTWGKESVHSGHFRRRKSRKIVEEYDEVTDIGEQSGGHGPAQTLLECRADLIGCQDLEVWVEQWQKNNFLLTLANSPEVFLTKRELDLYVTISESKRKPILRKKSAQGRALSESADLSMHCRKRRDQLIRRVLETVGSTDDTKRSQPEEVANAIAQSDESVTVKESQDSLEHGQRLRTKTPVGIKENETIDIRKNISNPYRTAPDKADFEMTINSSTGADDAGSEYASAGQCIFEEGDNLHRPTHGYQNEKSMWHSRPGLKYPATLGLNPSKCTDVITEGMKKSSNLFGSTMGLNKRFPRPRSLIKEDCCLERKQSDWPQGSRRARKVIFPIPSGEGTEVLFPNRDKYPQPSHRLSVVSPNNSRASQVKSTDQSEPEAHIGRTKHSKQSPESKINKEYDDHHLSGMRISPGLHIKDLLDDRYLPGRVHSLSTPREKQNSLQVEQKFAKQQRHLSHNTGSPISHLNSSDSRSLVRVSSSTNPRENTVNVSFPNPGLRKPTFSCNTGKKPLQNNVVRLSHITSNESTKKFDSGALNIPTSQVRRVKSALNKERRNGLIEQMARIRRPGIRTFNSTRPSTMLSIESSKRKRSASLFNVQVKRPLKSIWLSEDSPRLRPKAGLQITRNAAEGARNGSNNSSINNENCGSTSLYPNEPQNGDITNVPNLNTNNQRHQTEKVNTPLLRRFHPRSTKCIRQKLYWLQSNNGEMDQLMRNEVPPLLKLEDLKSYSVTPPSSSSVKGDDKRRQDDDTSDTFIISVASEFLHSSSDEQTAHKHRPRPGIATGRKKKVPETMAIALKEEQPFLDKAIFSLTQSVESDSEGQLSHGSLEPELSETTPQNGLEEQLTLEGTITPEQPNTSVSSHDEVLNHIQANITPIRTNTNEPSNLTCENDKASEHMTANREVVDKCKKARFRRKPKIRPPKRLLWEPIPHVKPIPNSRRPPWNNSTRPRTSQSKRTNLRQNQQIPRQRFKQPNGTRRNKSKLLSHVNRNIRKSAMFLKKTINSAVKTKRFTNDNQQHYFRKAFAQGTRRSGQRMRSTSRSDARPISMNNRGSIRNNPRSSIDRRSQIGERRFGKNQSENGISNDSVDFKIKSKLRKWLYKCQSRKTNQSTRSRQDRVCSNAATTRIQDHVPSVWSSRRSTSKPRRFCQQLHRFKRLVTPKCKNAKRIKEQNVSSARALIIPTSDDNRSQLGQPVDFIAYISIVPSEVDELVLPFRACNRLRNYLKEINKLLRKLEADLFDVEGRAGHSDTQKGYHQPVALNTDLPEEPIQSVVENSLSRSASLSTHEPLLSTKQLSSTSREGQVMLDRSVNKSSYQDSSNPTAYNNTNHSEISSMARLSTRPDTRRAAFWQQVLRDCQDHRLSRLLASVAKVTDRRIFAIEENTGCRIELNETTVYSVRGLPCMQFRISSHKADNLHRALVELETQFPKLYKQIIFSERFCDPSATGYGHQFPNVTEFFHGNQRQQHQPPVSTVCRVIPVIEEAKTDRNTISRQFRKRRRH
ncbi:hypothetical protein EG68_05979 [Paragonimus skrjabini miyazakii]|uniref:Uncharacterized protein n=1 Tax=Paragonimus skrjabini miyazakii TaxID=59628 RepID=A0A8S9YU37_9TREM|nr:hypothetical protein EG68_05979 [Paragonimus skrjabini miyazakii]